mmetsp:Transcript_60923/g.174677  ORF Transcript_60923/g.174677 Transcript_60923/m.174677 type:complete len:88 (-) Transcript_60923:575-838(-)
MRPVYMPNIVPPVPLYTFPAYIVPRKRLSRSIVSKQHGALPERFRDASLSVAQCMFTAWSTVEAMVAPKELRELLVPAGLNKTRCIA